MTHARIRAAQGDVEGARRVLGEILRQRPDHPQARALLTALGFRGGGAGSDERAEVAEPPLAGDARRLAGRFRRALGRSRSIPPRERIQRLRHWLERVGRLRGAGRKARSGG